MSFLEQQRALAKCLNRLKSRPVGEVLKDPEFLKFNAQRNRFNDANVSTLTEQPPYDKVSPIFRDQKGKLWKEETLGTKYHTDTWVTDLMKWGKAKKNRGARKFVRACPLPGYGEATHEMIIKRNGQREWNGEKMETFNFGTLGVKGTFSRRITIGEFVVSDTGLHEKFDIAPHRELGYQAYETVEVAGIVRIIDLYDLIKSGRVKEEDL